MIITLGIMAGLGAICFGLLGELTLRQQSILFSVGLFGWMMLRYRLPVAGTRTVQATVQQPEPVAPPAPTFVTPRTHQPAPVRKQVSNLTFYQAEANAINKQLAEVYKLNCAIDWKHPARSIVMGYGFINYVLTQTGPLRFGDLRKIEDDLAREINALHRRFQYGDVSVLAMNSQPMVLQVTRAKPQRLHWSERKLGAKPLQVLLGHYYRGAQRQDLVIDLAGKDTVWLNGSYFGMPTSGKSTILHIKLINLLEVTPPEMLEVYAIDLKADAYRCYVRLPHVRQVACEIGDAVDILELFEGWCTAAGRPTDGKIRLLLLDECQELFLHLEYGEHCARLISRIMGLGREAGIRIWQATQNPDKDSYPSGLKAKTHYMAAAMTTNDHYLHNVLGITGASKLREKGEFIFVGPFGVERLTTFWLTDEDRAAAIDGLVRKWGGYRVAIGGDGGGYSRRWAGDGLATGVAIGGDVVAIASGDEVSPLGETQFPIRQARPLTEDEKIAVRTLAQLERFQYRGQLSLRRIVPHVYGSRDSQRDEWVKEALEQ